MGAWGTGPLENDAAGDFVYAICNDGGLAAMADAFDHVLEAGDEDLEAPAAEEAVASAAIVARLKDGVPLTGEDEIEAWIAAEKPVASPDLIAKARGALLRVQTEPSELLELWQDADEFPQFLAGIKALWARLG
jgi:hypothetical protein